MILKVIIIGILIIAVLLGYRFYIEQTMYKTILTGDPVLDGINAVRLHNDLPLLRVNLKLNESAQRKACDMNENNYFAHVSPLGVDVSQLVHVVDYKFKYVGEILAKVCKDSRCVTLWLNSPTHKEVITNEVYREFGVGRCGVYTVVHFGEK